MALLPLSCSGCPCATRSRLADLHQRPGEGEKKKACKGRKMLFEESSIDRRDNKKCETLTK